MKVETLVHRSKNCVKALLIKSSEEYPAELVAAASLIGLPVKARGIEIFIFNNTVAYKGEKSLSIILEDQDQLDQAATFTREEAIFLAHLILEQFEEKN